MVTIRINSIIAVLLILTVIPTTAQTKTITPPKNNQKASSIKINPSLGKTIYFDYQGKKYRSLI